MKLPAIPATFTWNGTTRPVTLALETVPPLRADAKLPPGTFRPAPSYPKFIPAPDYSTPEAITQRCLEGGTRSALHLEVMALRESRAYAQFARAVVKAGGKLRRPRSIVDKHKPRVRVVEREEWRKGHGGPRFDLVAVTPKGGAR